MGGLPGWSSPHASSAGCQSGWWVVVPFRGDGYAGVGQGRGGIAGCIESLYASGVSLA